MREYELWIKPGEVDFAPETQAQEILQNVMTICLTQKYSVPMDRELGLEGGFLDEAIGKARAKLKVEMVRAVKKFEPRARVTKVEFLGDGEGEGKIYPRLRIRIAENIH